MASPPLSVFFADYHRLYRAAETSAPQEDTWKSKIQRQMLVLPKGPTMITGRHAMRLGATVYSPILTIRIILTTGSSAVPAHIRHLMRSTPNALTVITSTSSPEQYLADPYTALMNKHIEPARAVEENDTDQPSKIAGLLVSSFNTVTLTPKPYVSFNIKLPSCTYAIIKASGGFTASGLRDARIADALVKRRYIPWDPHADSFWLDWVENDGRLRKGKGGTWWMRCRLLSEKCVEVGDHMIVVARVLECGGYEGGEGVGLVYAEGGYRKVEQVADVKEVDGQ